MNKAVIYARFSSARQNEQSIEGQVNVCEQYAIDNNLDIIDHYIDRAASGRNDNRPAFQQMMRDSQTGDFNVVIVYQYDRFARNRRDSINNKFQLKKNGVKLLSATEPEITDLPADVFLEGILDSAAEFYSLDLAQKTIRGQKETLKKGYTIGGHTPFGFKVVNRKYEVEKGEAKIIEEIFIMYVNGLPMAEIEKRLHDQGYNKRGKKFYKTFLHNLIKDRKLIGEYYNPHTKELMPDYYPQVVDKKLFAQAQIIREQKLRKTRRNPEYNRGSDYILSGKLVCGQCGNFMTGISGRGRNGGKYRYYRCSNRECDKSSISKEPFEEMVMQETNNYFMVDYRLDFIVNELIKEFKKARRESLSIKSLEARITELKAERKHIADLFVEASPGMRDELNTKAEEITHEIIEWEKELAKTRMLYEPFLLDEKALKDWVKELVSPDGKQETRKNVVRFLVNSIFAFEDRVLIYLNFDEVEPITLDEAKVDLVKLKKRTDDGSFSVLDGGPSRN